MLSRVALVRTDVSEVLSASFIRVTRTGELGATLAVTSNRRMLQRNTQYFKVCKVFVILRSVRRLRVTVNVVPSSPILVTLMKEALSYSETSVLTRATRHNISEDAILLLRQSPSWDLLSSRVVTNSLMKNITLNWSNHVRQLLCNKAWSFLSQLKWSNSSQIAISLVPSSLLMHFFRDSESWKHDKLCRSPSQIYRFRADPFIWLILRRFNIKLRSESSVNASD
jgi:hypothetical protein